MLSITICRTGILFLVCLGCLAIANPAFMPQAEPPYDKVVHTGVFFIAGYFALGSVSNLKGSFALAALVFLSGFVIELAQSLMPGRTAEFLDIGFNALGVVFAIVLFLATRKRSAVDSPNPGNLEREVVEAYNSSKEAGNDHYQSMEVALKTIKQLDSTISENDARLKVIDLLDPT